MKLTVATNWDNALLDNFNEINKEYDNCIYEIYGSLRSSVVGNARAQSTLPNVSVEEAKKHIDLAHKYNLKFNYTFNAGCTNGLEFYKPVHDKILEYLDSVVALGIDSIVVAIPFYLELIKQRYPDIGVKVSLNAHVDSLQKLKVWNDLGADNIVVCESLNRDFEMLEKFRENSRAELELITSNVCLFSCAYQYYHNGLVAHMSQEDNPLKGLYVEYPVLHCMLSKFSEPKMLIRSRWIRPEDMKEYEKIGYNVFKIGARQSSTEWNTRAARAYASQDYDGNLLLILQGLEPIADIDSKKVDGVKEENWQTFKQGIESFKDCASILQVDNKKLDGFLEHYKNNPCRYNCDGKTCHYCKKMADRAVTVNDELKLTELIETSKFVIGGLSISEIMFE